MFGNYRSSVCIGILSLLMQDIGLIDYITPLPLVFDMVYYGFTN